MFDTPTSIGQLEIVDATHPLIAAMALESAKDSYFDAPELTEEEVHFFPCSKVLRFNFHIAR